MTFFGLAVLLFIQQNDGVVLFNPAGAAPTATANVRSSTLFPDVTVLDIVTVNLRDPNTNETFTISRSEDGTWVAPSSEGALNIEAATAIARTLVLVEYERTLPVDENTDLTQYGFDPNGLLFVEFILVDGTEHVMAVGGLSPDRQAYYVLIDDRPDLYLTGRGAVDFLIENQTNPPLT